MTNTTESDEDLQPEVVEELIEQQPTPGELLRLGREKMGLSIGQVADRLRLRHQQISELEDNVFTAHVSGTYIRGYLRSYAKLLQLDESEIIAAYEHFMGDQPAKGQMQSFSRKTSIETQDNRLMLVTWIIALILIGSVAVFVWQKFVDDREQVGSNNIESSFEVADYSPDGDSVLEADGLQPADDQLGDVDSGENSSNLAQLEPAVTNAPAVTVPIVQGPNTSSADAQNEIAATTASNPEVTEEQQTSAEPLVTDTSDLDITESTQDNAQNNAQESIANSLNETSNPAEQGELVLVFAGDSWIRIQDGSGEAIAYGVKESGYVMPLNGEAPYDLTLGAPHVVAVYFRGEQVDLSEFRGGRIARFTLPRS